MSEFDAAKSIAETLKGMDKAQQERAIRWAMETLGLAASPQAHPAVVPPVQPTGGGAALEAPAGSSAPAAPDIRSFVRSRNPKSDMQTATAVAYYYRFIAPAKERKETINGDDLADAIRKIGREQPKHPKQTLHNAKAHGYLDAAGDGQFRINSVGENLVTMTLGQNGPPEDGAARRKRGKKKAKQATRKSAKANKQGP
jgi:hypothetical protein